MMKIELPKDRMLTLLGEGISPGLAKGLAFLYILHNELERSCEQPCSQNAYKAVDRHELISLNV